MVAADDPPENYEYNFCWVGFVPQDDSTVVLDTIYLVPDDPMGYNGFIYLNPVNIIEDFPFQKQVVNFRWQKEPPSSVYGQSYDYISWECSDDIDFPVNVKLVVPEDWDQNPFEITEWQDGKVLAYSAFPVSHDFQRHGAPIWSTPPILPFSVMDVHITVAEAPPPLPGLYMRDGDRGGAWRDLTEGEG